jgi:hypothetical protein
MFYRSTIMARLAGERRAVGGSNVEVLRDKASKVMDRESRTEVKVNKQRRNLPSPNPDPSH